MQIKIELQPIEGYADVIYALERIRLQMIDNIIGPHDDIKNNGRIRTKGRWEITHCALNR